MPVHGLLVESVDLRRLGRSAGGIDVLGDSFDGRPVSPSEKKLSPLARKGACHGAADRASASVDHRNLVRQHHLWFLGLCRHHDVEKLGAPSSRLDRCLYLEGD